MRYLWGEAKKRYDRWELIGKILYRLILILAVAVGIRIIVSYVWNV
jgi:hypothetical protein